MTPLATNQLFLKWMYAFPSDESASILKKILYFVFPLSLIMAHFGAVAAGGCYMLKFLSVDLEEAIYALYHTICFLNMLYQSIAIVFLRGKLITIFKSLTIIYNESKNNILIICRWHF